MDIYGEWTSQQLRNWNQLVTDMNTAVKINSMSDMLPARVYKAWQEQRAQSNTIVMESQELPSSPHPYDVPSSNGNPEIRGNIDEDDFDGDPKVILISTHLIRCTLHNLQSLFSCRKRQFSLCRLIYNKYADSAALEVEKGSEGEEIMTAIISYD